MKVCQLNAQLAERSALHLDALVATRKQTASADGERGSCAFNLTLINAMDPASARPDLKPEPTFEGVSGGKAVPVSVSWHADSSLEHFSTIAVYHATDAPQGSKNDDWRVALRVYPDAEGPSAGKFVKAQPPATGDRGAGKSGGSSKQMQPAAAWGHTVLIGRSDPLARSIRMNFARMCATTSANYLKMNGLRVAPSASVSQRPSGSNSSGMSGCRMLRSLGLICWAQAMRLHLTPF